MREIVVVKSNESREAFDRAKIEQSVALACRKRGIAQERLDQLVSGIQRQIETLGESEVQILVASLDRAQHEVTEPENVLALVEGYHVERCAQIGFGMALGRRGVV